MKFTIPWPDDVAVLYDLAKQGKLDAMFQVLGLGVLGILSSSAHPDKPASVEALKQDRAPGCAPEFFPMLLQRETGKRIGYWVDDPAAAPQYVAIEAAIAAGTDAGTGRYWCCGRNLFETLRWLLEQHAAAQAAATDAPNAQLEGIRKFIVPYATESRYETGDAYLELYARKAASVRVRLATADTAEGMGIMVPATTYLPNAYTTQGMEMDATLAQAQAAYQAGLMGNTLRILKDLAAQWPQALSNPEAASLFRAAYTELRRKLLAELV
jgi:hypothetical protein